LDTDAHGEPGAGDSDDEWVGQSRALNNSLRDGGGYTQHLSMESNNEQDDTSTGTAVDVRGLEFVWGSDQDPLEFLRDINLAVAAGGRQFNSTRLMDVAVSCCDSRLRGTLNAWREKGGEVPGAPLMLGGRKGVRCQGHQGQTGMRR
jgi:hypothetical protein